MTTERDWFKSTHSGDEGGECLEASYTWFRSSHSGDQGGQCVETAYRWHRSTYSGSEGGQCVEVAACPATVHVRDSKNTTGPELALAPTTWAAFTTYAATGPARGR
ncbi:DUF397 domain-containing protein [Streptomyces uncialis]|uniref:DUF397 domain-containing protein n=1 Tax=Streptomyces uncialis TaxID=1048205 RepID=UPI002E3106BD|nr:DUF397 domain-containing protein [Streptomyces uncialis]